MMHSTEIKTVNRQCEIDAVHIIKKIYHYTQGSSMMVFFKSSFLLLMEFVCYVAAMLLVYYAFTLSNGIISMSERISNSTSLTQELKIDEVITLLFVIKVMFFASAAVPLIIALLLRKIRKKNTVLRKVNEKATDFLERHNID